MAVAAHQMLHAIEAIAILALFAFCVDFRRELADLWAGIKTDPKAEYFIDDQIRDFDREA
jgi:hypothetical protein